jgi:putative ABC transport system permease protein
MTRGRHGGLAARRAVVRWAWRLFRRDWRQQLLVLTLLTLTTAGALVGLAIAYNLSTPPEARFGTAWQLVRYSGSDPQELAARVAAARSQFGTVDVIGLRYAPVPGSARTVEVRAQDPNGPYGGPMLGLRAGRYPVGAGEVAVTDEVATLLAARVGERIQLDGRDLSVVGLVENPSDLNAEFVLVPPAHADPPETVTVLLVAAPDRFQEFLAAQAIAPLYDVRGEDRRTRSAVAVFGLVAVALFLVCFVAAAAFIVQAHRRMRQLGLLAAVGASGRHVRLVLLAAGTMTGAAAAVVGAVLAFPVWLTVIPRLEVGVGHRIEPLDLSFRLIGAAMLLAVITAAAAAWWPARTASRIPVTLALSMRPPPARPAHRSAIAGALMLAVGVACLRLAHQNNALLIVVGIGTVLCGLPFLGLPAIRLLAATAARLPVAARLAVRDLARHQARSGAALAAISLALAVPAATVIVDASSRNTTAEGNLSDRQLMILVGPTGDLLIPDRTQAQTDAVEAEVHRFTDTLGTSTVIPLEVAVDPAAPPEPGFDGGPVGRRPVELGVADGMYVIRIPDRSWGHSYLATPQLLRYLRVDPALLRPGIDGLTAHPDPNWALPGAGRPVPATTTRYPRPAYDMLPDLLINPAIVPQHGWQPARGGWLVEADRPLTTRQLAAARRVAIDNGLTINYRDTGGSLLLFRATATTAGAVLALGVLAMTVGLIRAEAVRDLRTLTATGATGRIRRALAATTAGALALLGALLGIAVAYLSVAAILDEDVGRLSRVPVIDLTITAVGVPLVAAAAAWLLAGREPRTLARTAPD